MGFGASRVQGIPKAPGGTVGPPWLLPGKVCPGNSFLCPEPGKEQPPPHSAPTHGQVPSPSCWDRGHPLCQQQGCPRAPQSTPVTLLKDIWCHQVVGTQASPRSSPEAGDRPRQDSTRTVPGPCAGRAVPSSHQVHLSPPPAPPRGSSSTLHIVKVPQDPRASHK